MPRMLALLAIVLQTTILGEAQQKPTTPDKAVKSELPQQNGLPQWMMVAIPSLIGGLMALGGVALTNWNSRRVSQTAREHEREKLHWQWKHEVQSAQVTTMISLFTAARINLRNVRSHPDEKDVTALDDVVNRLEHEAHLCGLYFSPPMHTSFTMALDALNSLVQLHSDDPVALAACSTKFDDALSDFVFAARKEFKIDR